MKLIHLADIHVGATSEALLEAARLAIMEEEGAALVVSGDLTQRGTRDEFQRARDWIDSLELPAIVVPGNHDTPLFHAGHRIFKPFARYGSYFEDLTRPLAAGPARLFPLNTSRGWQTRANWAEGSVDLANLDSMICEAEQNDLIPVMVCHHPFTPLTGAGLRTRTRRGEDASARLEQSSFRLLMTGHVHTPHAEWISGPRGAYLAVSAGTLSLRLRNAPPGFNLVDINETGVSVTPFSFGDERFSRLPRKSFSWAEQLFGASETLRRHEA